MNEACTCEINTPVLHSWCRQTPQCASSPEHTFRAPVCENDRKGGGVTHVSCLHRLNSQCAFLMWVCTKSTTQEHTLRVLLCSANGACRKKCGCTANSQFQECAGRERQSGSLILSHRQREMDRGSCSSPVRVQQASDANEGSV